MLYYDGIIFSLQKAGGISNLFKEIITRLDHIEYDFRLNLYGKTLQKLPTKNILQQKERAFERYRSVSIKKDCNIFHSTYYRNPIRGNINNLKVVTTVHDFTYEFFASPIKKLIHSNQKLKSIQTADKIICVSHNTKNDLIKFMPKIDTDRVEVIYNGVSNDFFILKEKDKKIIPYIIFVGERKGYKNFEKILPIFQKEKDLNLLCVGGGSFTKKELSLLEKYLPQRYQQTGYIENNQLNNFYNNAVCLIYPSSYEGFGIPVIEAMKAGCPVIALKNSSIPEISGDAAILLEELNLETLLEGLSSVVNKEKRIDLIEKGIINSDRFSWDITFTKTLEIYRSISS